VVKNKSYFKRYQTKFRRRREGKTDFQARQHMITQDKNKYNTPKYRLVVRFTNRDVITQITKSNIQGDVVVAAAYARELAHHGIKYGLTNYAAAYATGLLIARRILTKFNLAAKYKGVEKPDGAPFSVKDLDGDEPHPFAAVLDVGLIRTTTGHRVFGALKGAVDGGLRIPHTEKRFPGFSKDDKAFNPAELRKRIYGGHVADYMRHLEKEDADKYKAHFARYIKDGLTADKLEAVYQKAHVSIRKNPAIVKKEKKVKAGTKPKSFKHVRLTLEERKKRQQIKVAKYKEFEAKRAAASAEDDDDEDDDDEEDDE